MDKKKLNKLLKNGSSSESDLQELASSMNLKLNFVGSIYDLKSLTPGLYILLLSPSKKVLNGHWVALKVSKNSSSYFDSYGQPPPQILVDNLKNLHYNTKQIQALNHSHCGLYALYFLKEGPKMFMHFKSY
jgi:hypothetical protein